MNKKNTLLVVWLIVGLLLALTVGLCSNNKSIDFDVREYNSLGGMKQGMRYMALDGYRVHSFDTYVIGDYGASTPRTYYTVMYIK